VPFVTDTFRLADLAEMVNYLSHADFYCEFYSLGELNPRVVADVTEVLTRAISPVVRLERSNLDKCQDVHDEVRAALGVAGDH
jgi:hypothetical protein